MMERTTGGSCSERGRQRIVLVKEKKKMWSGGAEGAMKIACPQLRVPGWIPDMFDADSFISANLTA